MLSSELRPKDWDSIAGQKLVKETMRSIVRQKDTAPRSIILSGGFGCGKCVPGDVRIYTNKGYLPIKDLFDNPKEGFNDFTIPVYTRNGWKDTSHFYYEKNCKVYNIELDNGSILRGTDKHRILAYNSATGTSELMRMDSFKVGDYIFKNAKVSDYGNELSDPNLAFVLGMIVASGTKEGNYFNFRGNSTELNIVYPYLNTTNKITMDKRLSDYGMIRVHNCEFIDSYFDKDFNKDLQYIPKIIWTMDIASRVSFIQGIFYIKGYRYGFGESTINTLDKKYQEDVSTGNHYSYTCRCNDFIMELSELANSLGLHYTIYKPKRVGKYTYRTLKFKHCLPNTSNKLRVKYNDYISDMYLCPKSMDSRNDRNTFPVHQSIIKDYEEFYKKATYSSMHLMNMKNSGRITERTIRRLKVKYNYSNDKLNSFLDTYSCRIKKIYFTYEDVYDVTVPDGHEFIAQGIANHNTTSSRIFAKALNCPNVDSKGNPCNKPDCPICSQNLEECSFYTEYDASIVGNVEKIRELRDTFYYTTDGIYKVIVFDEIQEASKAAQGALLKVLEEAPKGVFFLFATTHPHKLLPTIISRSLQIKVTTVPQSEIIKNIKSNCEALGLEADDLVVNTIANRSKGHMRNAHMLLDLYQLVGREVFAESVKSSRQILMQYFLSIVNKNKAMVLKSVGDLQAFPVSDIKTDLDQLLLDMTRYLIESDDTPLCKLSKALGMNLLKIVKQVSTEWFRSSFYDDISMQTALLALWQMSIASIVDKTKAQVRTK